MVSPRTQRLCLMLRFGCQSISEKVEKNSTLFFSPRRIIESADGIYGSSLYALFSDKTNHILLLNPSDKYMKLSRGEVLGSFEPLAQIRLWFISMILLIVNVNCRMLHVLSPQDLQTTETIDPFGLSGESGEVSEGETIWRNPWKKTISNGTLIPDWSYVCRSKCWNFFPNGRVHLPVPPTDSATSKVSKCASKSTALRLEFRLHIVLLHVSALLSERPFNG